MRIAVPKKDERIDKYIEKAQPFAKPILLHIRDLVHQACPQTVETIKWGFPHFDYKGMMCSMASFKQHCSFGFWKASLMTDNAKLFDLGDRDGMGHFGKIESLDDLPTDEVMLAYIREACELNDSDVKLPSKPKKEQKELIIPPVLLEALSKNDLAAKTFDGFPYSCKKEYSEWVSDAKTDTTRDKRIAQTIEWLAEGKRRNWKYENC
jgi:uncharacterized protein YdeI (YjbR/CyaY-like superfamily)